MIKGAGGKEAGLTPLQASAVLRQWYIETPGKVSQSLSKDARWRGRARRGAWEELD